LSQKAAATVTEIAKPKDAPPVSSPAESAESLSPMTSTPKAGGGGGSSTELTEVLQKMNKKVKVLTVIRQQLTAKVDAVEAEKQQLLALVTEEILNGFTVAPDQDPVLQLQAAWRRRDEQHSLALQQLQSEFQSLQQQAATIGEQDRAILVSNGSSDWAAEKTAWMKQQQEELARIKESLEAAAATAAAELQKQHVQESDERVEKVKQAANAQLLSLKQKVAAARQIELEKLRGTLQAENEAKIQELVSQHVAELGALQQQQQPSAPQESAAIDALKNQHAVEIQQLREQAVVDQANEIERVRQIVEQSVTSEMEERLQELLGEMRESHKQDLEKQLHESAQKLAVLASERQAVKETAQKAESVAEASKKDLAQLQQSTAETVQSLHAELQAREKEMANLQAAAAASISAAESVPNITEMNQQMEQRLAELAAEHATDRSELMNMFATEKEELNVTFQEKLQQARKEFDATQAKEEIASQQELTRKLDIQKQKMEVEMAKALAKSSEESNMNLQRAVQDAESRAVAEIQSLKSELERRIELSEKELVTKNSDLQSAQRKEKALMVQIEELNGMLKSTRSGEENSLNEMNEALSKQRASYESMLEEQKNQSASQVSTLEQQFQEYERSRDEEKRAKDERIVVLEKTVNDRESILDCEAQELRKEVSGLQMEVAASAATFQSKEESFSELSKANSNLLSELAESKNAFRSLEGTYQNNLESLAQSHNSEIGQLRASLEVKEKELASVAASATEANTAFGELQTRYVALQSQSNELYTQATSVGSELKANLLEALNERERICDELKRTKKEMEELKTATTQGSHVEQRMLSEAGNLRNELEITKAELEKTKNLADEAQSALVLEMDKLRGKLKESIGVVGSLRSEQSRALLEQEAARHEMKKLESELTVKISQLEKEKEILQRAASVDQTVLKDAAGKHDVLLTELRASFEQRLEEAAREKGNLVAVLQTAQSTIDEIEARLVRQSESLRKAEEELVEVKESSARGLGQEEVQHRIEEMELRHALVLDSLKAEYESALKEAKVENVKLVSGYETNLAEQLEKQKSELASEVEGQARRFAEEREQLRSAMEKHVDTMTAQFKSKLESLREKHSAEVSSLSKSSDEKDSNVSKLVDKLKGLSASTSSLRGDMEKMKVQLQAAEAAKNDLQAKLGETTKELQDSRSSSEEAASSLLNQQDVLEREKAGLNNRLAKLDSELRGKTNKVEELGGKLAALTASLSAVVEEKNEQAGKLKLMFKQESKLKAAETEVTELREQTNKLKLDLTKNTALIERLQAEKESNERNHGQRTALVGMLETQLSEANDKNEDLNAKLEVARYDLSQKDETIRGNEDSVRKLEKDLFEARMSSKKATEALASAQKGPDTKTTKLVESLQREVQNVKQQMAKKSAAAQRLVQEKELECRELRKSNQALQHEVDKGSLSDRRILELAAKQSNRESQQFSEIEIRDKMIDRMKEKLLDRDGKLASVENHVQEVEGQVEELYRVRRREDVNIDYLKSTVVKYLSLPPGSSERAGLLPVLATLLQFDQNDYRTIEEGKNKLSWWGNVAPTLIAAPATSKPTPSISAEISVSIPNGASTLQTSTTSLQF
jgi:hypothetical protein